jgi:hypothetical protein
MYPIRGILAGCCAVATAPHIASVRTRATLPTNFRFWIADFRLSEQEVDGRFSDFLSMCFLQT